jgi:hypothetical protein
MATTRVGDGEVKTGDRFGELVALRPAPPLIRRGGRTSKPREIPAWYWKCLACGSATRRAVTMVLIGRERSCGSRQRGRGYRPWEHEAGEGAKVVTTQPGQKVGGAFVLFRLRPGESLVVLASASDRAYLAARAAERCREPDPAGKPAAYGVADRAAYEEMLAEVRAAELNPGGRGVRR